MEHQLHLASEGLGLLLGHAWGTAKMQQCVVRRCAFVCRGYAGYAPAKLPPSKVIVWKYAWGLLYLRL